MRSIKKPYPNTLQAEIAGWRTLAYFFRDAFQTLWDNCSVCTNTNKKPYDEINISEITGDEEEWQNIFEMALKNNPLVQRWILEAHSELERLTMLIAKTKEELDDFAYNLTDVLSTIFNLVKVGEFRQAEALYIEQLENFMQLEKYLPPFEDLPKINELVQFIEGILKEIKELISADNPYDTMCRLN